MLDLETTHNPHLVGFSEEDLDMIREEYPSFFKGIIPKDTYDNQNEDNDISSKQQWNAKFYSPADGSCEYVEQY